MTCMHIYDIDMHCELGIVHFKEHIKASTDWSDPLKIRADNMIGIKLLKLPC